MKGILPSLNTPFTNSGELDLDYNPFAYYTAAVTNSFVRVINIEKRNQNIRDDILEMNDLNPSYTRQAQGEWEASVKRNEQASFSIHKEKKAVDKT